MKPRDTKQAGHTAPITDELQVGVLQDGATVVSAVVVRWELDYVKGAKGFWMNENRIAGHYFACSFAIAHNGKPYMHRPPAQHAFKSERARESFVRKKIRIAQKRYGARATAQPEPRGTPSRHETELRPTRRTSHQRGYTHNMKPIDTLVRPPTHCQCGTITGYPCSYDLDGATAIPVSWVPEYLRGTATAAGNWGGVADDLVLSAECADDLASDWIKVAQ